MKKIAVFALFACAFQSCVSTQTFNELETRYAFQKVAFNELQQQKDSIQGMLNDAQQVQQSLEQQLTQTQDSLSQKTAALEQLQTNYETLSSQSDSALKEGILKNEALLEQIKLKEEQLADNLARVEELERLIAAKDAALKSLKKAVSEALLNFEGKGLTVEQREGKIYVSMENKLLFRSGSWTVGQQGEQALQQLAGVLAQNPDISVLIEGHTDDQPYRGKAPLEGNWDLSTKRATAIVKILLENDEVLPQNLTAAGRGEFLPIAPNSDADGRAMNRRIEVILTPNLGQITDLINQ
ncbi:MAG: OmpA family protein [Flavobacteriaceae bacterium]